MSIATIGDILTSVAGLAACGAVGSYLKWYVEKYCKDNEPIVWIWLEDNEPSGGHRVRDPKREIMQAKLAASQAPGM